MTSFGGFKWPKSGYVEAPDWTPNCECGGGLHGLLWGVGCFEDLDWGKSAVWLVVRVAMSDVIELNHKCKFRCGEVVYAGDCNGAIQYLRDNGAAGLPIVSIRAKKPKSDDSIRQSKKHYRWTNAEELRAFRNGWRMSRWLEKYKDRKHPAFKDASFAPPELPIVKTTIPPDPPRGNGVQWQWAPRALKNKEYELCGYFWRIESFKAPTNAIVLDERQADTWDAIADVTGRIIERRRERWMQASALVCHGREHQGAFNPHLLPVCFGQHIEPIRRLAFWDFWNYWQARIKGHANNEPRNNPRYPRDGVYNPPERVLDVKPNELQYLQTDDMDARQRENKQREDARKELQCSSSTWIDDVLGPQGDATRQHYLTSRGQGRTFVCEDCGYRYPDYYRGLRNRFGGPIGKLPDTSNLCFECHTEQVFRSMALDPVSAEILGVKYRPCDGITQSEWDFEQVTNIDPSVEAWLVDNSEQIWPNASGPIKTGMDGESFIRSRGALATGFCDLSIRSDRDTRGIFSRDDHKLVRRKGMSADAMMFAPEDEDHLQAEIKHAGAKAGAAYRPKLAEDYYIDNWLRRFRAKNLGWRIKIPKIPDQTRVKIRYEEGADTRIVPHRAKGRIVSRSGESEGLYIVRTDDGAEHFISVGNLFNRRYTRTRPAPFRGRSIARRKRLGGLRQIDRHHRWPQLQSALACPLYANSAFSIREIIRLLDAPESDPFWRAWRERDLAWDWRSDQWTQPDGTPAFEDQHEPTTHNTGDLQRDFVAACNGRASWHLFCEQRDKLARDIAPPIVTHAERWIDQGQPLPIRDGLQLQRIRRQAEIIINRNGDDCETFVEGGADLRTRTNPRAGKYHVYRRPNGQCVPLDVALTYPLPPFERRLVCGICQATRSGLPTMRWLGVREWSEAHWRRWKAIGDNWDLIRPTTIAAGKVPPYIRVSWESGKLKTLSADT